MPHHMDALAEVLINSAGADIAFATPVERACDRAKDVYPAAITVDVTTAFVIVAFPASGSGRRAVIHTLFSPAHR
jgi:hypothetical protein